MQLIRRDTVDIEHYRKEIRPSGYVGTVREPVLIGTVRGIVNPVTDSASIQLYGERVGGMIAVTVLSGSGISAGDIIKTGGDSYRVLSVSRYSDHDTLTAERIGNAD